MDGGRWTDVLPGDLLVGVIRWTAGSRPLSDLSIQDVCLALGRLVQGAGPGGAGGLGPGVVEGVGGAGDLLHRSG